MTNVCNFQKTRKIITISYFRGAQKCVGPCENKTFGNYSKGSGYLTAGKIGVDSLGKGG